jgi:hypothetical protein
MYRAIDLSSRSPYNPQVLVSVPETSDTKTVTALKRRGSRVCSADRGGCCCEASVPGTRQGVAFNGMPGMWEGEVVKLECQKCGKV